MPLESLRRTLSRITVKVKDALVQDVPPELHACEICQKTACSHAEWRNCEKRLAAARYLESGNREAIERLRELHRTEQLSAERLRQAEERIS